LKAKVILIALSLLVGASILIAGLGFNSIILPRITPDMDSSEGFLSMGDDSDKALMEGRIGSMSLIWDAMAGREILGPGQMPTRDMFETEWKEVRITSDGAFDRDTGELLFDDFSSFDRQNGPTFPIGGVEKRDYEIFNSGLNDTTTVKFTGTEKILGREAYVYTTNITDVESTSQLGGGLPEMDDNPLPFDGELEFLFSDRTQYVLDPRTSIPLDLRLSISSSFIFPDSTLLTVLDEQTQYSEETIWIPSSTIPGLVEETNVIKETTTRGTIDPEDNLVAIYEQEITFYYKSTGEPLPEDLQGGVETFAVDRETYQYMTGYLNTQRSGYFQFPVGSIRKMDYRMWDESLEAENTAEYIEETTVMGRNAYIFRMITDDVEIEGGNAILPISPHPGTNYRMDTIQEWYIDSSTGFMLDFKMDGTIRVESSGPLGIIDQSVGSFEVDLPDNTTSQLLEVAELFEEVLLPLSNEKVEAFSMELSFTEEVQRDLIEISDEVFFYLDLFERRVPMILAVAGVVIILIPVSILTYGRIRRNINKIQ
jgi:hypothetical protein